ncbi:hypothetical protein Daesc_007244 [Daldinia eschscholtzii]|uniref:Uncharacterized protein n=1 Tax=Daldinia eschscholtzii TaxID=292717 RepID=A0AAX6MDK3_9PEZI
MSVLSGLKAQEVPKRSLPNPKAEATLHRLFSESSHSCHEFRLYAVELLEALYLPKQCASGEGSFSWVYHITDLNEPSKSLDTSLFAFCLAQLHVTGTGGSTLYQCLDQYNTALQHLYSDLADSEMRFREETLAAIVVLSTCELFTLEALTKRQAQILENDIWRQIVTESGLTVALDEVYRMVADIPAFLERAVALPSISDHIMFLKEAASVTQSILAMVDAVESWHDEFWKASPTPRSWSVPSQATNPTDVDPSNKIFPFCFEFESLGVAVPVVMCWSVCAQLYSTVIQIHNLVQARLGRHIDLQTLLDQADASPVNLGSPSSQNNLLPGPSSTRSIQDIQSEGARMARFVCQSMEYFHRIEMGTYGGHATTYPSWSARQYFRLHPGHEREWLWIQNMHMMEGPNTRWGLSLMTFADIAEPLGGWSR